MTTETVIKVKNLSKKFRRFSSVGDAMKEFIHPFRKRYHSEFWALKDVSFEIKKGESVGIVGRNGSGKSTLLQILCGIMQPTSGGLAVNGRIAALLELGAGFHPMFTGRDNVYLNGALLGFTKDEMEEKFASIAGFADIGDFIDQPVMMYSSGMFVRLAFSVAIHVDPEILIVDEALAVGDEAFQRKCYGRINAIKEKGSTVIFVSHSASTIVELCGKAMLFDHGELLMTGSPKAVVSNYHKLIYAPPEKSEPLREEIRAVNSKTVSLPEGETLAQVPPEPAGRDDMARRSYYDPHLVPKSTVWYEPRGAQIENPRITTLEGETANVLVRGEEYIYTYDVTFTEPASHVRCGMLIKTISGVELGGMVSHTQNSAIEQIEKNTVLSPRFSFRCALLPGTYFLNAGVVGILDGAETYLHRCVDASMFRVQSESEMLAVGAVDFSPL